MELHAEDPFLLHRRRERTVVVGAGDLGVDAARRVRVHEVERCGVGDILEERSAAAHAVPADLWDGQHAVEASHFTAEQSEAGSQTHFGGEVEQHLMAYADAEEEGASGYGLVDGGAGARLFEPLHRSHE